MVYTIKSLHEYNDLRRYCEVTLILYIVFFSGHVFRPFIEQGASPSVLWSRGASPPE